jgi:hypothetical protein
LQPSPNWTLQRMIPLPCQQEVRVVRIEGQGDDATVRKISLQLPMDIVARQPLLSQKAPNLHYGDMGFGAPLPSLPASSEMFLSRSRSILSHTSFCGSRKCHDTNAEEESWLSELFCLIWTIPCHTAPSCTRDVSLICFLNPTTVSI